MMTQRIGILGGTFNPVHNGHLAMADASIKKYGLEKVIFIPTALPPHKPSRNLVSNGDRIEMLRLVRGDQPEYEISEIELERGGKSYTVDTIRQLEAKLGAEVEIYLIIGTDNLLEIAGWREIKQLIKLCHFIVVTRPGFDLEKLNGKNKYLASIILKKDLSNLLSLSLPISSSQIRDAARKGKDLNQWVPSGVADYIRDRGLYLKIFPSPRQIGAEEKF